ncbi:MAG: hypothetical protein A4E65_03022 [Syntrophorhabdus sp. PtaU1.Bin153]|nr:MAG: hypothetical protein A4E65_03022 [Syntrophorhabdus sp. PtaU1.Bin153]
MATELYDDLSASDRLGYVRSKLLFLEAVAMKGFEWGMGNGEEDDSANSGEGLELILHGIGNELRSIEKQIDRELEEARKTGGAE